MHDFEDLPDHLQERLFDLLDEYEERLKRGEAVDDEEILSQFKGPDRELVYLELQEAFRFYSNSQQQSDIQKPQILVWGGSDKVRQDLALWRRPKRINYFIVTTFSVVFSAAGILWYVWTHEKSHGDLDIGRSKIKHQWPFDGSEGVVFKTIPANAELRVYPLLPSGEPDGENEFFLDDKRICYLDPGLYYCVCVIDDESFIEVIREVPVFGMVSNPRISIGNFKTTTDGIHHLAVIEIVAPNLVNAIEISGFLYEKSERLDQHNQNWDTSLNTAEKCGGVLPTREQIEMIRADAEQRTTDEKGRSEWTLTRSMESKRTEKFVITHHNLFDDGRFETCERYSRRDGNYTFRVVRRIKPYSPH